MQIVVIVWLGWTGFTAKQGSTQVVCGFWSIALFYLPLATVIMKLSRQPAGRRRWGIALESARGELP